MVEAGDVIIVYKVCVFLLPRDGRQINGNCGFSWKVSSLLPPSPIQPTFDEHSWLILMTKLIDRDYDDIQFQITFIYLCYLCICVCVCMCA